VEGATLYSNSREPLGDFAVSVIPAWQPLPWPWEFAGKHPFATNLSILVGRLAIASGAERKKVLGARLRQAIKPRQTLALWPCAVQLINQPAILPSIAFRTTIVPPYPARRFHRSLLLRHSASLPSHTFLPQLPVPSHCLCRISYASISALIDKNPT
jgi:hypothetical protein